MTTIRHKNHISIQCRLTDYLLDELLAENGLGLYCADDSIQCTNNIEINTKEHFLEWNEKMTQEYIVLRNISKPEVFVLIEDVEIYNEIIRKYSFSLESYFVGDYKLMQPGFTMIKSAEEFLTYSLTHENKKKAFRIKLRNYDNFFYIQSDVFLLNIQGTENFDKRYTYESYEEPEEGARVIKTFQEFIDYDACCFENVYCQVDVESFAQQQKNTIKDLQKQIDLHELEVYEQDTKIDHLTSVIDQYSINSKSHVTEIQQQRLKITILKNRVEYLESWIATNDKNHVILLDKNSKLKKKLKQIKQTIRKLNQTIMESTPSES